LAVRKTLPPRLHDVIGRHATLTACLAIVLLVTASCAPHIADMTIVREEMARGNYECAHSLLKEGDEDDVLYLMEKGLLSHYAGLFAESNEAFERAEVLADDLYTKSISKEAAALLTSDLVLDYAGSDMERAMIHFYRALNYINLGMPEDALVESRKLNQRLVVIRGERAGKRTYYDDPFLQYVTGLLYEWGGEPNDALISYKAADRLYSDLGSEYGVAPPPTIKCDIERTAEASGIAPWDNEPAGEKPPTASAESDATEAGRVGPDEEASNRTIEKTPQASAEAAADDEITPLEGRVAAEEGDVPGAGATQISAESDELKRRDKGCARSEGYGEVVLILELGFVAHKEELVLHIPILKDETSLAESYDEDFYLGLSDRASGFDVAGREVAYVLSVAIPHHVHTEPLARSGLLDVGEARVETVKAQDLSAVAVRNLNEKMPRVLAKTAARALVKYLAKEKAEDKWGGLAGALFDIAGSATEHADTRSWLSLPSEIHLARLPLPAGTYDASLRLLGRDGGSVETVDFGRIEVVEADVTFLHHRGP
jgi:tetratricopeptide (TPR) repeat protein